jgi:(p)ppGpp synthase/HD superfamily hydrolase
MGNFEKRKISLRYWLHGRGFTKALEAMEFGSQLHDGFRKDKVTPEFDHQVSIGHYVRTLLPSLLYPEETMSTVFLHDTREDYGVSSREIRQLFGSKAADAVDCLTKKVVRKGGGKGLTRDPIDLFARMSENPIASIVKAADRVHNLQSMIGVFSEEKQVSYIKEVRDLFLPMLKSARRNFPAQELAYENAKHMLLSQIELIEAIHTSK